MIFLAFKYVFFSL